MAITTGTLRRSKARSQVPPPGLPCGCKAQVPGPSSTAFLGHSRELDRKRSSRDRIRHPNRDQNLGCQHRRQRISQVSRGVGVGYFLTVPYQYNTDQECLGEILKMVKDDSTVRCFQGLLIFGNVITGMCGIALTAECIFFVSDQHSLYPLLEATNNDDIYGAAWIGMFVGICLFCLSVLGIVGIVKSNRKILLAYFILMFIVYGFEVASCITAATQRDFFTPNLFLKQMLERYQNNSPPTNDDQWKNNGVTRTWDRLMLQDNCCGVNGPSDWQKYTSAFRAENNDADYPWPRQCCVMTNLKEPLNLEACKLGVPGYYHNQGCYELISGPMNRHAWGVAWFGFAILCWTFWVLLGTMFYWSRIEY